MDKTIIKEIISELDDLFVDSQEPFRQVFGTIDKLINSKRGTNSLELNEFLIELNILLKAFYEEMADVHTPIIEAMDAIEKKYLKQ